jgi:hypothetical protein
MDLNSLPEEARKAIGALCLYGLTESLIDPPSLSVFTAASRVVFTESDEFQKIADLLSIDVNLLRKNVFAHLEASGVRCQGEFYH